MVMMVLQGATPINLRVMMDNAFLQIISVMTMRIVRMERMKTIVMVRCNIFHEIQCIIVMYDKGVF